MNELKNIIEKNYPIFRKKDTVHVFLQLSQLSVILQKMYLAINDAKSS